MKFSEDFEEFFESSRCGFVITDSNGAIVRANKFFCSLFNSTPDNFIRRPFSQLLTIGGQIYWETHLWPLLRIQGFFDEAALEFSLPDGKRIQVLVNAFEEKNAGDTASLVRLVVYKATDRYVYEQNLKLSRLSVERELSIEKEISALREQFIAVLGHDLRNPLGAILGGTQLLAHSNLSAGDAAIVSVLERSAKRMEELIANIMDLARTRLGSGLSLQTESVDLSSSLFHVIDELKTVYPNRHIETDIQIPLVLNCDKYRMAQLFSNLLANALTHGTETTAVRINAAITPEKFQFSIINGGDRIPPEKIERLFEPFTREADSPSKQGLGLGLYISSQIAIAHGGTLTATSNDDETCFTLSLPLPN